MYLWPNTFLMCRLICPLDCNHLYYFWAHCVWNEVTTEENHAFKTQRKGNGRQGVGGSPICKKEVVTVTVTLSKSAITISTSEPSQTRAGNHRESINTFNAHNYSDSKKTSKL